jgi:hypothetical protein
VICFILYSNKCICNKWAWIWVKTAKTVTQASEKCTPSYTDLSGMASKERTISIWAAIFNHIEILFTEHASDVHYEGRCNALNVTINNFGNITSISYVTVTQPTKQKMGGPARSAGQKGGLVPSCKENFEFSGKVREFNGVFSIPTFRLKWRQKWLSDRSTATGLAAFKNLHEGACRSKSMPLMWLQ